MRGRGSDEGKLCPFDSNIFQKCYIYIEAYICTLSPGDSAASLIFHYNATLEAQIGTSLCYNGNGTSTNNILLTGPFNHNNNNNNNNHNNNDNFSCMKKQLMNDK